MKSEEEILNKRNELYKLWDSDETGKIYDLEEIQAWLDALLWVISKEKRCDDEKNGN